MKLIHPNIYHCPDHLRDDSRLVMYIILNGKTGNLGAFTVTQLMIFTELDRKRVKDIIQLLLKENLIRIEEWVRKIEK